MSESKDIYIKWNETEWASVAKRAAALKVTKPELSWTNIAVLSQDDITPERRRPYFNKIAALKPLFALLSLDEEGNPRPPAPPEPEPAPAPVAAAPAPPKLSEAPIDLLLAEIFNRGARFKTQMEQMAATEIRIRTIVDENNYKLVSTLKRIDEVEAYLLQAMEDMEKINATYARLMEVESRIKQTLSDEGLLPNENRRNLEHRALPLAAEAIAQTIQTKTNNGSQPQPPTARLKFLLVGLLPKDMGASRTGCRARSTWNWSTARTTATRRCRSTSTTASSAGTPTSRAAGNPAATSTAPRRSSAWRTAPSARSATRLKSCPPRTITSYKNPEPL